MSANLEQEDNRLCVLRLSGELKKPELNAAESKFLEIFARAGTIKLLVLLENFTGWERGGPWGGTDFFFKQGKAFERIALVCDPRREAEVLARTGVGLCKGPVKFFPLENESMARDWLAD